MNLPPNVQRAAQAIAKDEKRALFPLTRLNAAKAGQIFHEQVFAGDHSDIGGGWEKDQNMLAYAPLKYIWNEGRSAGVPFGPLPKRELKKNYTPHDNRGAGHTAVVTAIYNLNPIFIIAKRGFTSPALERNLKEGPL